MYADSFVVDDGGAPTDAYDPSEDYPDATDTTYDDDETKEDTFEPVNSPNAADSVREA